MAKADGLVILSVRVPLGVKDALKKSCKSRGLKIEFAVLQAVKEYLVKVGRD